MKSALFAVLAGCGLGQETLDEPIRAEQEQAVSTPRTVGILYGIWHCPSAGGTWDLSNILESDTPDALGPVNAFHWWGKPRGGYYCLSQNDAVLREHATLLKAAGIDYVFVDITNWPDTQTVDAARMIVQPFERLLAVWGAMGAANTPKIIPWVRVSPDAPPSGAQDMIEYARVKMTGSALAFVYNNKPVVFVAHTPQATRPRRSPGTPTR